MQTPILDTIFALASQCKQSCYIGFVLILFCTNSFANSIQVVDQFGKPIENVVVSYDQDAPNNPDPQKIAVMDQVNIQFLPHVLVIQKEQTVAFPNSDNTRHHIYSFSQAKPFEIKMFTGGESKQLTFEQPGIVVLGCNIHDQMVGYIYVAENANTAMTNVQGIAEVPKGGIDIKLWHPKLSTNKMMRQDVTLPDELSEQPYTIVLTLIEDIVIPEQPTFKSKKFNRGN